METSKIQKGVGFAADVKNVREDESTPSVGTRSVASSKSERNKNLTKSKTSRGGLNPVAKSNRKKAEDDHLGFIIWPWSKEYRTWWGFTVFCALLTIFTETYGIAFIPAGLKPYNDASSIIEYILVAIFALDMVISFNLAYYDFDDEVVTSRKDIAINYIQGMFWYDLAGVIPLYQIGLAIAGELGNDSHKARYLAILRLVKLVRLHRTKQLFDILQYNTRISLFSLTLTRNFVFCFIWSHFSACVFYFIARQYDFDPDQTWIGGSVEGLNQFERYLTSLYWSVVTFTTVGYGDYSPVNSAEQIWGMLYMLLNIIAQAWMIGSITLLIVKQDEKTGDYRDTMAALNAYSEMNDFSRPLKKSLETQLILEFNSRELSDETVLSNFPAAVRRKVLRRLYLPYLMRTSLMRGIRQQFVDAFLSACKVEIFSPGEEILQRGSVSADLYLLVSGSVRLSHTIDPTAEETTERVGQSNYGGTSIADSDTLGDGSKGFSELGPGEFINEIGFFTESPQIDTVKTKTVCKTLTMSRAAYKLIADDHPDSIAKVLQNLLQKAEEQAAKYGERKVNLPTRLSSLRSGSAYGFEDDKQNKSFSEDDFQETVAAAQAESALCSIQDIVTAHMNKQKDDNTTRFLFAASRGDTTTIALMCDQGFDPDTADYDNRTALMVAAMKGNTDTVQKLLEYGANPNIVDMHGSSALFEATGNGHEATMEALFAKGASLCLDEGQSAAKLCDAVAKGDMLTLRRLLRAKINVNAGDYDKRTCSHVAAAEGNLAAIKLLAEFGANFRLADRWSNTVFDEAKRVDGEQLLKYLENLDGGTETVDM